MIDEVIVICNIYSFSQREQELLPHFVKHYRDKLFLKIIIICDPSNDKLIEFCHNNNITTELFDLDKTKLFGVEDSKRINKIKNKYNKWFIPVDLDEFINYGSFAYIQSLIHLCIKTNKFYVVGYFLDRFINHNYSIKSNISLDIPIEQQFPFRVNFTKNIMKGCDRKICLCHPSIDISRGHHDIIGTKQPLESSTLIVDHYKWFGSVLDQEIEKMKTRKNNNSEYWIEQNNLFKYLDSLKN